VTNAEFGKLAVQPPLRPLTSIPSKLESISKSSLTVVCSIITRFEIASHEAGSIWPGRATFILSIGTGVAPGNAFKGNIGTIVERLKDIVTRTERTADGFYHNNDKLVADDLLFRFNVTHNVSNIGLGKYKGIPVMAHVTQVYLDQGEICRKLEACISRLSSIIPEGNTSSGPYSSLEP
jgi:hypothetical protein